jgi:hypothetical protein
MMRCDLVLSFRVSVSEDYRMRNMTVVLGSCVWDSPKALTLLGRTELRIAICDVRVRWTTPQLVLSEVVLRCLLYLVLRHGKSDHMLR